VHYVSYLIDLVEQQVKRETVAYGPDPQTTPTHAFVWKIVCDADGRVVVFAELDDRVQAIAGARWRDGLADRGQRDPDLPNEHQWAVVEDTLRNELGRIAAMGETLVSPRVIAVANVAQPDATFHHVPAPIDRERLAEVERRLEQRRREGRPQPDPRPPGHRVRTPAAITPRKRTGPRPHGRVGVVVTVGLGLAVVGGVIAAVMPSRSAESPPKATSKIRQEPRETREAPTTPRDARPIPLAERIASATSFAEVLEHARTAAIARGGTALELAEADAVVRQAAARMTWSDVDVPAETTLARIEKDFEAERGKRLCATGTIHRIRRDERPGLGSRKVYSGQLETGDGEIVGFIAVGTTGELVKRSAARLCGLALSDLAGIPTILGMFDLPENRAPIVEQ
jgi:hypothetical protein